jgi:hypothetical protein
MQTPDSYCNTKKETDDISPEIYMPTKMHSQNQVVKVNLR